MLSIGTHIDSRTDSQALRAEYCIVGIPHNTAIQLKHGMCKPIPTIVQVQNSGRPGCKSNDFKLYRKQKKAAV